jgi:hypothetical protein
MVSPNLAVPTLVLDALFWIAVGACVVSQFFIFRAVWRVIPPVTGPSSVPAPRRAAEVVWALLPALLMVGAFVGAWRLMHPPIPTGLPAAQGAISAPAAAPATSA